jgi:glutamate-5-semialdehyde dehydrogenase
MINYLFNLGKNAKKASIEHVSSVKKNQVLRDYIVLIKKNYSKIISENQKDLKKANDNHLKENLVKRLLLDKKKTFTNYRFY